MNKYNCKRHCAAYVNEIWELRQRERLSVNNNLNKFCHRFHKLIRLHHRNSNEDIFNQTSIPIWSIQPKLSSLKKYIKASKVAHMNQAVHQKWSTAAKLYVTCNIKSHWFWCVNQARLSFRLPYLMCSMYSTFICEFIMFSACLLLLRCLYELFCTWKVCWNGRTEISHVSLKTLSFVFRSWTKVLRESLLE